MTFEDKYIEDPDTGCWVWQGKPNSEGYGRWGQKKAHRVALGDVPADVCVLHKCDNRMCVNPDHLYIGGRAENARDRGNRQRGTAHQYLTDEEIYAIVNSDLPAQAFVDLGIVNHRNTVYYWRKRRVRQ